MLFQLLPTIDIMIDLYERPRTIERFQTYLKTIQGDTKGDLAMPLSGFNPMAKEHLLQKLIELKQLKAEQIIHETLADLNKRIAGYLTTDTFSVAPNVSDDLLGGWTNRYTSDYDSKFKISALIARQFCVPVFWASESFTPALIKERTLEYVYRTIYWTTHPKPKMLKGHVEQEKFVAVNVGTENRLSASDVNLLDAFYNEYKDSDSYSIIFNFLYGDSVSKSLAFPTFGILPDMAGFDYAKQRAES